MSLVRDAGVRASPPLLHRLNQEEWAAFGRLDGAWWAEYRANLEKRFRQEELVIRATETGQL